jgi:hypothetical protein
MQRAVRHLILQLSIEGDMEIVILMAWSIWKCRNGWIFENIPPTIERRKLLLSQELKYGFSIE